MKILVLNPNSSEVVSEVIMKSARKKAKATTELVCLTNPKGTKNIDCACGDYMSSHSHIKACLEKVKQILESKMPERLSEIQKEVAGYDGLKKAVDAVIETASK